MTFLPLSFYLSAGKQIEKTDQQARIYSVSRGSSASMASPGESSQLVSRDQEIISSCVIAIKNKLFRLIPVYNENVF